MGVELRPGSFNSGAALYEMFPGAKAFDELRGHRDRMEEEYISIQLLKNLTTRLSGSWRSIATEQYGRESAARSVEVLRKGNG